MPLVRHHCDVVVCDGRSISFWFDSWSLFGPVWEYLSVQDRPSLTLPLDVTPREAVHLRLPGLRRQSHRIVNLVFELDQLSFTEGHDVWSRKGIPKQEFVVWMLFHGKLTTRNILLKWGMCVDPNCAFCSERRWCITQLKGKSFKKRIMWLAFMCAVYFIWQERNARLFGESSVYHMIVVCVQDKASSWKKVKRSEGNWRLGLNWGLDHYIFS
ncbi:hypothetical protein LIER_31636 [Lithospermum erythrorhizon]|uniref:Reverse transcriptase zinc-binding domain-containing protein n=1 Tax=Lithospermum erythrorhizon TaxID=34254 RepID=A0AAV3RRN5_LITER